MKVAATQETLISVPLFFWYSSESGVVGLLGGAKKEPERAKKVEDVEV